MIVFHNCDLQRPSDSERLLQRSLRDAEEGLELRDDYASPPIWLDKLEEAQYTISKYAINFNGNKFHKSNIYSLNIIFIEIHLMYYFCVLKFNRLI